MEDEQARVLARDGSIAVVQLTGRAFPGVHVQGDTFAGLQRQPAAAAASLRRTGGNDAALEELDAAVEELAGFLQFYESLLSERGIRRPHFQGDGSRAGGPGRDGAGPLRCPGDRADAG